MPTQPFNLTTERNITIGAGYCYFNEEDENGNLKGDVYLGDGPGFTLTLETENQEVDSQDTPVAETLIRRTVKVTRSSSIGVRNVSSTVIAYFIGGAEATVTQTATPVTDEPLNEGNPIYQGRYYQLGKVDGGSTPDPVGVYGATSISLSAPVGATVDVDYKVDEANARIYVIPGSTELTDGLDTATANYTPVANSRSQVITGAGPRTGEFRFITDNTEGGNKTYTFPRCELVPDGDAELKSREDPAEFTFALNILSKSGLEQMYVDDEPVAT